MNRRTKKLLRHSVLGTLAMLFAAPFFWMLLTSLRAGGVGRFTFDAYAEATSQFPLLLFFWNSTKISLLGTIGELFVASLAAFAFARMRFVGKKVLYVVLLLTMMIPFQVTMIPVFLVIEYLGLIDSQASLILPHYFGGAFAGAAFGVFLLRGFFESIPQELSDAAQIDGVTSFRYFYSIVLPLSKPALTVLALFVFMGIWNDLLSPVLFLSTESKMPLTYGLAALQQTQYTNRYDILMAGTLVSVLPIVLLYIASQRWITDAFMTSGVKG